MPLYDYRCRSCGKRSTLHQAYSDYGVKPVHCPHCSSADLQRVIGRIRVGRSEESRLDNLSDPTEWGGFDENDPRSMARMMRRMGQEMGEDVPAEYDEVVDRLEAGEDPEDIEQSMPELGGGDTGGEDVADFEE
jgi:putative FmdB family regulatory protein